MLRLPRYQYHRPTSLTEALSLLAGLPEALPIAGGTDLVPNMKHHLWTPAHLVSLGRVPELRGIEVGPTEVRIGAGETLAAVAVHPEVRRWFPSLATAASKVGGPQVRNRGTLGGNLCLDTRCTYYNQTLFWRDALGYCLKKDGTVCHVTRVGRKCVAAHSADTVPVLMTLGATVDLATAEGVRSLGVDDFFVADGQWNTVRRRGELVVGVRLPLPRAGLRTAYQKVRQRGAIDYPLLSVAVAAEVEPDGRATGPRVVVTALGSRPRVVTGLDRIVAGRRLDEVAEAVAEQAWKQCHPLENIIVDPEWRRAMVPVYVKRALRALSDTGGVQESGPL